MERGLITGSGTLVFDGIKVSFHLTHDILSQAQYTRFLYCYLSQPGIYSFLYYPKYGTPNQNRLSAGGSCDISRLFIIQGELNDMMRQTKIGLTPMLFLAIESERKSTGESRSELVRRRLWLSYKYDSMNYAAVDKAAKERLEKIYNKVNTGNEK